MLLILSSLPPTLLELPANCCELHLKAPWWWAIHVTPTTLILSCWCSVFTQASLCLFVPPQIRGGDSKAPPSHVVEQRHSIPSFNRPRKSSFCFSRLSPQPLNKLILLFYSPCPYQCSQTFQYFTAVLWIKQLVICSSICLRSFLPWFHHLV